MRAVAVLVALSFAVMVVLIGQAIRQELNLRRLKSSLAETSARSKQKEESIVQINLKIQEVHNELSPLNRKKDALLNQKRDSSNAVAQMDKTMENCINEKAEAENQKNGAIEALQKTKDDYTAEKKKAEEEIQGLKQQILDRDKKVCAFVDPTMAEGRKLCGIADVEHQLHKIE